jgi:imidazolonepropionase-like amidohydrolase
VARPDSSTTPEIQVLRLRAFLFAAAAVALLSRPLAAQDLALVGATLWNGTAAAPIPNATIVIRDGKIVSAGTGSAPAGARVENLAGRWIVPGLVDGHAHVSGRWAGAAVTDEAERIREELKLYSHYGVTSVASLGDEPTVAARVREDQKNQFLDHARFTIAGPVIGNAQTPEAGRAAVAANAQAGVDWIKIRVDDNLGTGQKMAPEVSRAVIQEAHTRGLKVAAHVFYLADAKQLLRDGVDLIAHSIRDDNVDFEALELMKEKGVCYVPTIVREISAFVYAFRPSFFDDPFFTESADAREVARLSTLEYQQQLRTNPNTNRYRLALVQAQKNLARLLEANVPIAFGTDAGQAGRFPGYFEHLELSYMKEVGMTPEQVLRSATQGSARCLGMTDVGTLEPGKWADLLVLRGDPLQELQNLRLLDRVYIAGNRVR